MNCWTEAVKDNGGLKTQKDRGFKVAKFCGKCGKKLNKSGKCPCCEKKIIKRKRGMKRSIAVFLVLMLFLGSGAIALVWLDVVDAPIIERIWDMFDAKELSNDGLVHMTFEEFQEINIGSAMRDESEVLETIDATSSQNVLTEQEIAEMFNERGFGDLKIYTTYDMDGAYFEASLIDENNKKYHPLYVTTYINSSGDYWTVYNVNGDWAAEPISYLYSGLATCAMIISENEYITSYDSQPNCFYRLIPPKDQCVIKEIPRIDATSLDNITIEDLSVS